MAELGTDEGDIANSKLRLELIKQTLKDEEKVRLEAKLTRMQREKQILNEYNKDLKNLKVYIDYKTNLDIYSKKRFAPFCRHERIYIPFDEDNLMETTLGQLNFFRWVFKNYILEYMESNYEDIKRDMEKRNNSLKRRTSSDKSASSVDSAVSYISSFGDGEVKEEISIPTTLGAGGKTRKKREILDGFYLCLKKNRTLNTE
jgi:hypothetical protein